MGTSTESETTWEIVDGLRKQFQDLHLEDKVNLESGGIVRPPIILTYKLRGKRGITQIVSLLWREFCMMGGGPL